MYSFDISALTNDLEPRDGEGVVTALQYAVRRSSRIEINGDQEWVRDGSAVADGGGVTLVRDVTVTYGPWRLADQGVTR